MTDKKLLNNAISRCGLHKSYVAEYLGLSIQGFYNKATNKTEFTISEMVKLCELLHIGKREREAIFFADKVDESSTDAETEF